MPFIIVLIGIMLISSGARNRAGELGALIAGDFSGENNFFVWIAALGGVGAVGYYEPMKGVSRLFMFLLLLSMILSNRGFFAQLVDAIQTFEAPPPSSTADTGQATADPGATITGDPSADNTGNNSSLSDLVTKYGGESKIPDTAGLPSDFPLPLGAANEGLKSIGDFRKWYSALPQDSQMGPSKSNPNVAPGQPNSRANDFLNRNLGTLMPDLYQGIAGWFQ